MGGEWTTTLRFTNRGTKAVPVTNVYLADNNGNPVVATFRATNGTIITASGFSVSLGVGAMVEATFISEQNASFGHAIIACSTNGCGTPGI